MRCGLNFVFTIVYSRNVRETDTLNKSQHLSQLSDGMQSMRLNCDEAAASGRSVDVVDSRYVVKFLFNFLTNLRFILIKYVFVGLETATPRLV